MYLHEKYWWLVPLGMSRVWKEREREIMRELRTKWEREREREREIVMSRMRLIIVFGNVLTWKVLVAGTIRDEQGVKEREREVMMRELWTKWERERERERDCNEQNEIDNCIW